MATMGHPRSSMRGRARRHAAARNKPPKSMTALWDNAPLAVMRTGPVRRSVSACFAWSMASLKKLQAIWMHRQEAKVSSARRTSQWPVSFCTTMQPAHTGIRDAVSVFGRAARKAEVMMFMKERERNLRCYLRMGPRLRRVSLRRETCHWPGAASWSPR